MKGQVAIEFFLYTGIFMLITIAGYFVVDFVQSGEIAREEYSHAKELGGGFMDAINLAAVAGDGFSYNFTFPKTSLGKPYIIQFDPKHSQLILTWEGNYGNFSYPYTIPAFDYQFEECIKKVKLPSATVYELKSNECRNILNIRNDGKRIIITQPK